MNVNVGAFSDPDDIPGLAHFLEHMLFMGTEKYPKESEYTEYLTSHGGVSNAYTAADHTNYYFNVEPSHLAGALDRYKADRAPNAVLDSPSSSSSPCSGTTAWRGK